MSYCLAQMVDDLAVLNTRMFEWLREDCILATFIDPILAWHRLLENSNEAMQVLSSSLRALAARTQQHVGFDHHVTKVTMADPEGHVGNLAAVRGGGSLAADARWAFTLARLNPVTVAKYGIAEAERKRYRRFDSLKTSYGADDDDTRLLRVEDVHIANGELVGVLVEADPQLTRSAGAEREATERERWRARLAAELDRMLREQRPRSARVAALRLTARAPDLFLRPDGKPLGEDRIRRKLLLEIGDGLPLPDAPQQRVVWRPSERRGDPAEIDLEQGRLL
jgi:hypothetical protein